MTYGQPFIGTVSSFQGVFPWHLRSRKILKSIKILPCHKKGFWTKITPGKGFGNDVDSIGLES